LVGLGVLIESRILGLSFQGFRMNQALLHDLPGPLDVIGSPGRKCDAVVNATMDEFALSVASFAAAWTIPVLQKGHQEVT
jgi:hypothetical protein